jgi:hypothetical protein
MNPLLSDPKRAFKSGAYHNAKHSHQSDGDAMRCIAPELKKKWPIKNRAPQCGAVSFNALLAVQALSHIISR